MTSNQGVEGKRAQVRHCMFMYERCRKEIAGSRTVGSVRPRLLAVISKPIDEADGQPSGAGESSAHNDLRA